MHFLVSFLSGMTLVLSFCTVANSEPAGLDKFLSSRQVVASIYFDYGSSSLNSAARTEIKRQLTLLSTAVEKGQILRVEGFSSPEGNKLNNFKLSLHRARSVAEYLKSSGLKSSAEMTGYGSLEAGSVAVEKDRRVDIALYKEIIDFEPLQKAYVKDTKSYGQ